MSLRDYSTNACSGAACGVCAILLSALMSGKPVYAQVDASPTTVEIVAAVESRPDIDELQAFRNAVAKAESTGGVYGARLAEQLMGLGLALQQEGRHADAVEVFKRGSHLARINNGLDTAAQIPFLEREIFSHLTLGELGEVDEAQTRLYRAQIRSLGGGEAQVDALIQQGKWQLEAYNLGVGGTNFSFSRLLNMWDLNRMALTIVIERESDTSPQLLPPLNAMLQTQYLISGHKNRRKVNGSDYRDETASAADYQRFKHYRENSYEKGRTILRAIYDIQVSQNGEKSTPAIQARIMLADWMLWYGVRAPAMRIYSLAAGDLAQLDDAQVQTERLLGAPIALPDIDGVRPLLPEVGASEGNILLEFGVNPNGSVIDLVRVRENEELVLLPGDASQDQAKRLMLALRKTKFRPRFVEGEPTLTENIVKAFVIN